VAHDSRAGGLRNAVTLSKHDRLLPRMKWKWAKPTDLEEDSVVNGYNYRAVAFVDASDPKQIDGKAKKRNAVFTAVGKPAQAPANM
jgi:hypothetical protein